MRVGKQGGCVSRLPREALRLAVRSRVRVVTAMRPSRFPLAGRPQPVPVPTPLPQDIKREVLAEGALQPVINLLSSPCAESQREAALLLGQFATTDNGGCAARLRTGLLLARLSWLCGERRGCFGFSQLDGCTHRCWKPCRQASRPDSRLVAMPTAPPPAFKSRIAQRGAIPPLIRMLSAADTALREMAAFALGRLAQDSENQVSPCPWPPGQGWHGDGCLGCMGGRVARGGGGGRARRV